MLVLFLYIFCVFVDGLCCTLDKVLPLFCSMLLPSFVIIILFQFVADGQILDE
jgi:hypothetical protein